MDRRGFLGWIAALPIVGAVIPKDRPTVAAALPKGMPAKGEAWIMASWYQPTPGGEVTMYGRRIALDSNGHCCLGSEEVSGYIDG